MARLNAPDIRDQRSPSPLPRRTLIVLMRLLRSKSLPLNLSGQRKKNWSLTKVWFLPRFLFLHFCQLVEFVFLATVTFGLFSWDALTVNHVLQRCCIELNWNIIRLKKKNTHYSVDQNLNWSWCVELFYNYDDHNRGISTELN